MRHALLALLALSLAACSFDRSALDDRPPCDVDDDCPSGSLCVAGSCWPGTIIEPDMGVDAAPDAAGVCEPASQRCDGDTLEVCRADGGGYDRTSCDDVEACEGIRCACINDACRPAACEPGTRRCDGQIVEVCVPDGTGYATVETCALPDVCVSGACVPGECEPGELFCGGDVLFQCSPLREPALLADCASTRAWCNDTAAPRCESWSCEPGTARCAASGGVQQCNARGNGYGDPAACEDGTFCDDGVCVVLDCTPGTQTCVGPAVYATCRADGESPDVEACDEGTFCLGLGSGAVTCAPQQCAPGDRRCRDGAQLEICDERGAGYNDIVACDPTEYCADATCTERVCEPGASACADDFTVLRCDALGAEQQREACGAGTFCATSGSGASCQPQSCVAGTRRCGDVDLVEICDARGGGFIAEEICPRGQVCDETFRCAPTVCTPNAVECSSGLIVQTCNALGTAFTREPCAEGRFCADGVCVPQVCTPGQAFCSGADLLRCDASGSGSATERTCPFGCADGACQTDICGNGVIGPDEECDDGNTNPCDGCDACRVPRYATIGGSTRTTNTVNWTPGSSDFTFEAWVYPIGAEGAWFGAGARTASDFVWAGVTGGRVRFEVALETGVVQRLTGNTNVVDGRWHHVAVQRFSIWGLAIWVDGNLDAFAYPTVSQRSIDGDRRLWIGSDGETTPAEARIDDLRVSTVRRYRTVFAPSRLIDSDGNTLALYRFDEPSGGELVDASGNGRTLSVTGLSRAAADCRGAAAGAVRCGDGAAAPWEECDDGNTNPGDGCHDCRRERCGAAWTLGPGDRCYLLETARNWESQRNRCRDLGGDLVAIDNQAENDWLTYLFDLPVASWIGLNDRSREGTYVWSSGSAAGFRFWASGEPNNRFNEDCVQIGPASAAGRWNDLDCGDSIRGICERAVP